MTDRSTDLESGSEKSVDEDQFQVHLNDKSNETPMINPANIDHDTMAQKRDIFCWVCGKKNPITKCTQCIRSVHKTCAGIKDSKWTCDECTKVPNSKDSK